MDAKLTFAKLHEADLTGAHISYANFHSSMLSGADLSHVSAAMTGIDNVDLGGVKGLSNVVHEGPSTVGIDTIYRSKGKIPEVFLRGCGVADEFIAYIGSMVGRPIEYYSCFISHSILDQEFAGRLYADLQAKAVRCWFAPHDIKGGGRSTNKSTRPFACMAGCC